MPGPRTASMLALLLLAAACRAAAVPAGASGPAPASAGVPGLPSRSAGCGHPPASTGYLDREITVAGKARRYQLYVPDGSDGTTPLPLVLVFHGRDADIGSAE